MQGEVKAEAGGESSLKASMCMSAAYCVFVQHPCFTPGCGVGSRFGSGCDVDLHESPDRVHSVEHAQREAEVHDGKPGGVAVKRLFQSVLKDGVSPKGGHDPELKRGKEKKSSQRMTSCLLPVL